MSNGNYAFVDERFEAGLSSQKVCLDPGFLKKLPPAFNWSEEFRKDDLVVASKAVGRLVMRGVTAARNKLTGLLRREKTPRDAGNMALQATVTIHEARHRAAPTADWGGEQAFERLGVEEWDSRVSGYPILPQPEVGAAYHGRHVAPPEPISPIKPIYMGEMDYLQTV